MLLPIETALQDESHVGALADRRPRLSAELFVIPLDAPDDFLIYAPLRRAALVGNAQVVNLLADVEDGADLEPSVETANAVEFLRALEILDAPPESKPVKTFQGDPQPTSVTLYLTTACNLRCTYCYASAGETPVRHMPLEVAQRGIDYVAANAKSKGEQQLGVVYHGGGEPSVHWSVMKRSREYAEQKACELGLQVTASSATNGVLTDSQIDWMIANLDGVSLSFDGLPEVQDKHRLTVLGTGSSERVVHTMRRFDAAKFPYGLRMTVTADQIERLPDSVEFVCHEFQPRRIQVEPAFAMGRWKEAPSAETEGFIDAFREAQARAAKHGKEITYSAARVGTLTNHFCGVSQDTFALTPDGEVSACYEVFSNDQEWSPYFVYGKQTEEGGGYDFEFPILNNLRKLGVENREFCQGCYAKWSCAGDCFHKSLSADGKEEFAGSDRCHITRELTKDQILAKIAAAGGLFWHEGGER